MRKDIYDLFQKHAFGIDIDVSAFPALRAGYVEAR